MATHLILNADDFGLTPGVNRTIARLHTAGALSSATLMATGAAFDDAVRLARELPTLGVGCHIVLTDGRPVSPPARISSLLGPDGRTFRSSLPRFVLAALRGQLRAFEIELEVEAQISRLQDAGIRVTHVDTHKHTHLFPAVLRPLLRAAVRRGVPAIRNPFEHSWSLDLRHGTFKRRTQIHLLNRLERSFARELARHDGAIRSTHGTVGIAATGDLQVHSLRTLLEALPPGTWELVCHPGENDLDLDHITTRLRAHREHERDALLKLVPAFLAQHPEIHLVDFGHLASSAAPQPAGLAIAAGAQEHS